MFDMLTSLFLSNMGVFIVRLSVQLFYESIKAHPN